MLERDRSVIGPAVVRPGDTLFVERLADGADIAGWNGAATGNAISVDRAIRQEAGELLLIM